MARVARKVLPVPDPVPGPGAVLAVLPDAVLLVDGEATIRYVNGAAEQLFALGAGVICDRPLEEVVSPDSALVALVAQARCEQTAISEYGVRLSSPRTPERVVDLQAVPVDEFPDVVVVTLRERSVAHKLAHQLTFRGAARSLAGLAAALAHEVKNPLSGIRGAAQLLEQSVAGGDRSLARLITEETDRICRLVDRMEVFSDRRPLRREPVNIHEVLERVRLVAQTGFGKGVRFVERYDPSLPSVYGDRDQLIQMFLNLVKNAAEAVPRKGGEITLTTGFEAGLSVAMAGSQSRLRLPLVVTIEDNGPGVAEDMAPHLFEPFLSGRAGGTGLGLPLAASIACDHGGVIEFDSRPRRTVFRVLLPVDTGAGGEG
ncbi:MAG: nitrogen regulation protein NR(II) [Alphaproteobacteria bacterium]